MSIKTIFLTLVGLLGLLGGVYFVADVVFSHNTPSRSRVLDVGEDPQNTVRIDVDKEYSDIVSSFNQQDYQQVINLSHKFLRTYPRSHFSANVLFKIAESYYRLGDLSKARAGYQRVVQDFPGSQMAQFAGIKLDLLGKVGTESSMDSFLKLETPEKGYQECRDLYKGRDFDRAIKGFENFLQKYPNSELASNAQYWLAECYYAQDDFRKAKREFERVLENYPGSRKTPSANRKILMTGQKLAQQDSERKLKQVYDRLYGMYQKKDYRGAISGFKAFIQKYPNSNYTPNAYYWIAECYYAASDYQDGVYKNTLINLRQAKTYFDAVIRKFPASEKAIDARTKTRKVDMISLYVKARKAYLADDLAGAIKNFKTYLNRYPKSYLAANCRYWAGVCYFDQQQYRRAIAELKKVQKDYPKHHKAKDAGIKIAEIREILGESEDPQALSVSDDEQSAFNKIRVSWANKNFASVIENGEKFLQKFPEARGIAEVQFLVGESYFNQKRFAKAVGYFEKVLNSDNESIKKIAQKRYRECQVALGQIPEGGSSAAANGLQKSKELAQGIQLCQEGDWDGGLIKLFPLRASFAQDSKQGVDLQHWIGRCYFEQKEFKKARFYLSRVDVGRLDKENRESHLYSLAFACYNSGDLSEAKKANQSYLQEFKLGNKNYRTMLDLKSRLP